jgi:hypothetical protein
MEEKNKKHITRTHLIKSIQCFRIELTHLLDRIDKLEELVNIVYDNEAPHKQTILGPQMESITTKEKVTVEKQTFCTRPSKTIQYASREDLLERKVRP